MKRFIVCTLFALGAAAATPSFALTRADHIGEPASPQSADRTVLVSSYTRSLNVRAGEVVNLQWNGQTATWDFDGIDPVVKLSDILPGAPDVNVYVALANDYYDRNP
jgi:hypothetical protein